MPEFADGVWLVTLVTVNDGQRLPGTVAQVLGVSERADEAIADTLQEWLQGRDLLLILDNCEHVVDAVSGFLRAVIAGIFDLHLWAVGNPRSGAVSYGG